MNTFNMIEVIKDSTRVTDTTKSIIDLIMVSDVDKISQQGVLPSGVYYLLYKKNSKISFEQTSYHHHHIYETL